MKRFFLPLSLSCLIVSGLAFSGFKAESKSNNTNISKVIDSTNSANLVVADNSNVEAEANELYDRLDLSKLGMAKDALKYAYKGYHVLEQKGLLRNSDIITVCDFSQSSSNKRMYIIDLKSERVLVNTYVAHGKNSGLQYAENFSNIPSSLQSSLGFYVTKGTYIGKHGRSLKLAGLEKGFNDNAESRAVVIHGAVYIGENKVGAPYMGRSFGCPAVPQDIAPKVIDLIKYGSCLFIYNPNQRYLHGSRILNG